MQERLAGECGVRQAEAQLAARQSNKQGGQDYKDWEGTSRAKICVTLLGLFGNVFQFGSSMSAKCLRTYPG